MTARNIVGKCFPLVSCRAPPTKSRLGVDVLFRETYATVTGGYMSQGFKALKVIFFGGSHWAKGQIHFGAAKLLDVRTADSTSSNTVNF
jgi:hypothetical protein